MEFLRFGSSIPGEYWGCCACDIIQNFSQSPSTKASIQLVTGDSGTGITHKNELAFAGPTLKDIFETRIRIGTFGNREMPNHAFFAILTEGQCNSDIGKEWLKLLKDNGFEFLRCVDNSVWSPKKNYIFALFRNCGPHAITDPFEPPASWKAINQVVPETWEGITGDARKNFIADQTKAQKDIWSKGKTSIKTESEIVAAGAPVVMAGLRTEFPVELKATRETKMEARNKAGNPVHPSNGTQHIYE